MYNNVAVMAQLSSMEAGGRSRSENKLPSRQDWSSLSPVKAIDPCTTTNTTTAGLIYPEPDKQHVEGSQRSPKRHNPLNHERIRSKVSRSVSNGESMMDGRRSPMTRSTTTVCTRPNSLVVSDALRDSNVITLWSCDNCTLDNAPGLQQCEACEAPRTFSSRCSSSGVVVSASAWEPRGLSHPSPSGPLSYRRSFSEVESVANSMATTR